MWLESWLLKMSFVWCTLIRLLLDKMWMKQRQNVPLFFSQSTDFITTRLAVIKQINIGTKRGSVFLHKFQLFECEPKRNYTIILCSMRDHRIFQTFSSWQQSVSILVFLSLLRYLGQNNFNQFLVNLFLFCPLCWMRCKDDCCHPLPYITIQYNREILPILSRWCAMRIPYVSHLV